MVYSFRKKQKVGQMLVFFFSVVKLTLTRQEEEVREKVRVSLTLFDYESWYSSTEHVSRLLCHSGVKPGGLLA